MPEQSGTAELANELFVEQIETDQKDARDKYWHRRVALSTLIFAMLAALGGLLSGITANESQQEKMKEIISLTILEGDRVSVEVLQAKHEILRSLDESPDEAELAFIQEFEGEIAEKREEVKRDDTLAKLTDQTHLIFAISVAFLAAGISLSGMSVVISERWLWVAGSAVSGVGTIGIIWGISNMLT